MNEPSIGHGFFFAYVIIGVIAIPRMILATIDQSVAPFTQQPYKIYVEYDRSTPFNLNNLQNVRMSQEESYRNNMREIVEFERRLICPSCNTPEIGCYKYPSLENALFKRSNNSFITTTYVDYTGTSFEDMKSIVDLLELVTDGKCRKITGVVNTYSRYGWFKFNKVYYSMNYTVDCKQDYTL